ncbi:MAG: hypothetical protein U1F34_03350 [Gammaproteobacteria bacterium]
MKNKHVKLKPTAAKCAVTALATLLVGSVLLTGCTKEQQNRLARGIQNWTGTDGVLDIYAGDKLVRRFIKIDKMTTGIGTQDNGSRAYRFGYGVVDENFNYVQDAGEKRVYFEVSDYSTSYVFYENYKD